MYIFCHTVVAQKTCLNLLVNFLTVVGSGAQDPGQSGRDKISVQSFHRKSMKPSFKAAQKVCLCLGYFVQWRLKISRGGKLKFSSSRNKIENKIVTKPLF